MGLSRETHKKKDMLLNSNLSVGLPISIPFFFPDGNLSNYDGYTNSMYTISIGAIDYTNAHPNYAERCSAQIGVTYSNGNGEFIVRT